MEFFFSTDKTLRHPVLRQERDIPELLLRQEDDLLELCQVSQLPILGPVLQFIIDKVFGVELSRQFSHTINYQPVLTLL